MTTSRAEPPGLASPPPPRRLAGGGAAGALYQGEGRGRRGRVGVLAEPGLRWAALGLRAPPRRLAEGSCWREVWESRAARQAGGLKAWEEGEGSGCSEGCVWRGGERGGLVRFGGPARGAGGTWLLPPPSVGSQPARPFSSTLVRVQPWPSPPLE